MSKVILVITDGIGYNSSDSFNAFANAKTKTYDYLFANKPHSLIKTYGEFVGLPKGQMGNSEVGHMSIGSGRVLYQDLVKISIAIDDGSISENITLNALFKNREKVHLVGLCSDGGVHSHIEHIIGLAKVAKSKGKRVFLHLVTDGRDVSPTSVMRYINKIEAICDDDITIATISGRFYTMDRDERWQRVEKGYKAIVEATPKSNKSIQQYIDDSYANGVTDEFIAPCAFGEYSGIEDGDGIIICNFRSDRVREISKAIGADKFDKFQRDKKDIELITLTEYDENFTFDVMFSKEKPENTLAETISKNKLSQLHTSETEKYAHVTYFFNGGVEKEFEGEKRVLVESPKVETYDLKPEMSAKEVCDKVLEGMQEGFDFIVVNFANGDMVGHTGNFDAGIKAVESVDEQISRILNKLDTTGYDMILTSDHGNCEMMRDESGNMLTNHTVGEVYCFVVSDGVDSIEDGSLCNIAPTVLKLMNIEIPKEMSKPLF
jgi:2,3-bisphosphoglycerate-independent phosphoglycerate mutase